METALCTSLCCNSNIRIRYKQLLCFLSLGQLKDSITSFLHIAVLISEIGVELLTTKIAVQIQVVQ